MMVYGWMGWRNECPPAANGSRQTREIMATKSVAEVMRATGLSRSHLTQYGGDTGNPEEVAIAMSAPGVVFWRPLVDRSAAWTRA